MHDTSSSSTVTSQELADDQREIRARVLRLRTRLREQRARMRQAASYEFEHVVEVIADRLGSGGRHDLVAYHIREVWERFALDLPDNWQDDMTRYVRRDVERAPWFRVARISPEGVNPEQLRALALLLVASSRQSKPTTFDGGGAHG